tara:strand:- start:280 stop:807 length:528 start_codon:yes stop_codon:yes gene_type:complete
MSQLKVNSIVPVGGLPSGSNGGIIQVVQTVKTDTFSQSNLAKDTMTAIVLSQAITPSSNANKILVRVDLTVGCSADVGIYLNLFRDSTQICRGDANGVQQRVSSFGATRNADSHGYTGITFLDSPSTTSSVTYGVKLSNAAFSSASVYLNRTDSDQNQSQIARGTSVITLMEVTT